MGLDVSSNQLKALHRKSNVVVFLGSKANCEHYDFVCCFRPPIFMHTYLCDIDIEH